jgi:hypothetical protein
MIRRFLLFFIILELLFAQDTLITKSGKIWYGTVISNDSKQVVFQPSTWTSTTTIRNDKIKKLIDNHEIEINLKNGLSYEGMRVEIPSAIKSLEESKFILSRKVGGLLELNGDDIESIYKNGTEIWSYEIFKTKQAMKIQKEKNCTENQNIKMMVMPFKNDFYGVTDKYQTLLKEDCYDLIHNLNGLEYLDEKNLTIDLINDFYLTKIGEKNNCDYIIHGFIDEFKEDYKHTSIILNEEPEEKVYNNFNNQKYQSTFQQSIDVLNNYIQNEKRKEKKAIVELNRVMEISRMTNAMRNAGTYVTITYFGINLRTKEKIFFKQNEVLFKKGTGKF